MRVPLHQYHTLEDPAAHYESYGLLPTLKGHTNMNLTVCYLIDI